jgi:Holliday junction DNA helicase RuvB
MALLSSPLRSRFSGGTFRLNYYNTNEIKKIIERSAKILSVNIEDKAALKIAERSRFTPRVANRLLKRCRDFAQVNQKPKIDKEIAKNALKMLEIDSLGLEKSDIDLLKTLIEKFNGGPAGLQTLAAATGEEIATIEEVYEPYLIQLGFLERTPRGRVATPRAYEHLNIDFPEQKRLL